MGKYEATSQRAAAPAGGGKKKKHIGLWITLAVLAVVVCWGVWFFTTPPDQNAVNNGNAVTDSDSQLGQYQAGSESEDHIDAQPPEVQQPAEKERKNPSAARTGRISAAPAAPPKPSTVTSSG